MNIVITGKVKTTNFTVDKTPMLVDNSIKQGDFAPLQRRFEIKSGEKKTKQGCVAPKQSDFVSLQRCF